MSRRAVIATGAGTALGAAVLLVRRRSAISGAGRRARGSLRTSSSPSARLYERTFGWLLGGLYDRVVEDAELVLGGLAAEVLEVGPGPGGLAERLARRLPAIRLTGVDVDPAMVALAGARATRAGVADRLRFVVGDVADLPLADGSVDLVLSTFSVHHWDAPTAGFAEIRRVLRPGGRAIVYDLHERWTRFETRAPDLADAALAGGFGSAVVTRVRWPGPLPLIVRLEVTRPVAT